MNNKVLLNFEIFLSGLKSDVALQEAANQNGANDLRVLAAKVRTMEWVIAEMREATAEVSAMPAQVAMPAWVANPAWVPTCFVSTRKPAAEVAKPAVEEQVTRTDDEPERRFFNV